MALIPQGSLSPVYARLAVEQQVKEEMVLAAHKRLVECFSRDIIALRRKARELPVHLIKVRILEAFGNANCFAHYVLYDTGGNVGGTDAFYLPG